MTAAPRARTPAGPAVRLGLAANWPQFTLLIVVNVFVGGMVGLERATTSLVGTEVFHLSGYLAIFSFIVAFGVTKAVTNLVTGPLAARHTRKALLVAGWAAGLPVPFLLAYAPAWGWIVAANVLLGVNQGLAWSMTVNMKIDLVGPRGRGLAMGLNEAAGYMAVGATALATGYLAAAYGLRPVPELIGAGYAVAGLALSVFVVRDTAAHVALEAAGHRDAAGRGEVSTPPFRTIFAATSWRNVSLRGASQAGLVSNLNDGLTWGVFPLLFTSRGLGLAAIGLIKGVYPLLWGAGQPITGRLSDTRGRKPLIVTGMLVQAGAFPVALLPGAPLTAGIGSAVLLGLGTAMVYPALIASVADHTGPSWRAQGLGVYRFWRDLGYALGAVLAALIAQAAGLSAAVIAGGALTFASGLLAALWITGKPAPAAAPRGAAGGDPRGPGGHVAATTAHGRRKGLMERRDVMSPETLAAQALGESDPATGGLVPMINLSTNYEQRPDGSYPQDRVYTRADNPTSEHAERLLAALEGGGCACALFGSGMAAVTAVFQSLLPGDHVLVSRVLYWGVRKWLAEFALTWGLDVEFTDTTDLAAVAAAIRPGRTRLLWAETPANPMWEITDLAAACDLAHRAGVRVAVDNTVATPVLTRPFEHGVDLVVHSATKYLNGHGDVLAGAVLSARRDPFWERIRSWRRNAGAMPGPFEAWLLQRGMRTLFLRVRRASETAMAIAGHFDGHPALTAVLYPGLTSHPGHQIAARQMDGGYGGMLSIRLAGGARQARAVLREVRVFKRATSLGGVESLIEHRRASEGPSSPVPDDLLRLSAGIEAPVDLIADLEAALKAAAREAGR